MRYIYSLATTIYRRSNLLELFNRCAENENILDWRYIDTERKTESARVVEEDKILMD